MWGRRRADFSRPIHHGRLKPALQRDRGGLVRERLDGGLVHVEQALAERGEMDAACRCGGRQKHRVARAGY